MNEWKRSQKGLESCCSESRSSGNELSLRSTTALSSPQSTRVQQGMEKEVFKASRRKEKMAREKQRGKKERERNESPFFVYLQGEASAIGYHGDPRPERPQPIGRDVGANEKARCCQVLRWLPVGTVRTGECG